jgi:hypothetical protein
MAAMTLVVVADRSSALTRLSPFPCHPTYDRLVRNGPVKQSSHIGTGVYSRPNPGGLSAQLHPVAASNLITSSAGIRPRPFTFMSCAAVQIHSVGLAGC